MIVGSHLLFTGLIITKRRRSKELLVFPPSSESWPDCLKPSPAPPRRALGQRGRDLVSTVGVHGSVLMDVTSDAD